MNPDPLQSSEKRLFDAARMEAPPEGAEERVIAAARKRRASPPARPLAPGRAGVWLLLAALVLSALMLLVRRKEPTVAITAEPSQRAPMEEAPPPAPAPPASAAIDLNPPPRQAPQHAPSSRPAPPATLADELTALKRAEGALADGNAAGALAELDRYDGVLHGKQMRAEAALLRMEALSRAGKTAAAGALAARFVAENPESPLVDRARTFLIKKGDDAPEGAP
jgi:hypothetical protein